MRSRSSLSNSTPPAFLISSKRVIALANDAAIVLRIELATTINRELGRRLKRGGLISEKLSSQPAMFPRLAARYIASTYLREAPVIIQFRWKLSLRIVSTPEAGNEPRSSSPWSIAENSQNLFGLWTIFISRLPRDTPTGNTPELSITNIPWCVTRALRSNESTKHSSS